MRKLVVIAVLMLTGCHDDSSTPTVWEQFDNKCQQIGGYVVQVESSGWNDFGRFHCMIGDKQVYVPDAPTGILQ